MQFDTTINHWNTAANTGRINGSNPCSEYMHLDDSACNLASLNLLSFLDAEGQFDVDGFKAAIDVVFTAQEILVGNADYPTEKIGETARAFRELGLGYANLGAMLMALGLPYDSDAGPGLGGSDHRADDRSRLRGLGPHVAAASARSTASTRTRSRCCGFSSSTASGRDGDRQHPGARPRSSRRLRRPGTRLVTREHPARRPQLPGLGVWHRPAPSA